MSLCRKAERRRRPALPWLPLPRVRLSDLVPFLEPRTKTLSHRSCILSRSFPLYACPLHQPWQHTLVQLFAPKRRFTAHLFLTTCEFEIKGEGSHQNPFDLGNEIRRQERILRQGGSMRRQLNCITVDGKGSGAMEVEGILSNGVQTVTEVRLRFNAHGKPGPVSIGLCDVRYVDGEFKRLKEMVAQVNTLTFRRQQGPPKMEVTVASVKKKAWGNTRWQSIKGGITGGAVNLLIDPLIVEKVGHQAMLDFGQALVSGTSTFTFPPAKNLKEAVAGQANPQP